MHHERITKVDRRKIDYLGYVDIKFPVSKKDSSKIVQRNNTCLDVFCYEND